MRIKLKKGLQKELILSAKLNLTWRQLAQKLDMSPLYLKNEVRNELVLLSDKIYNKLCAIAKINYDFHIIEKLNNNWGMSKGGKNAGLKNKKAKILVKNHSAKLAELIGIILGDGNIWVKNGGYYYVRICGDAKKEKDYLLNHVNPLFESIFGVKMHLRRHNKDTGLILTKGSKNIVFTLNRFGIPSGSKIKNNVGIPSWILSSKKYTRACIRGLIDTDGSVFPLKGRNYPYIWFSCNIPKLRKTFKIAMKNLGFKLSKWNFREGHAAETYIANKYMVKRFSKEIHLKNKKYDEYYAPIV